MRGEDQMSDNQVCYTFDAAVEMAIQMEEEGFRHYLAAIRQVTNKGARELLRENALDELNHKHQLEKALLDGQMSGGGDLDQPVGVLEQQRRPLVGGDAARPADGEGLFVEIPVLEEVGQLGTGDVGVGKFFPQAEQGGRGHHGIAQPVHAAHQDAATHLRFASARQASVAASFKGRVLRATKQPSFQRTSGRFPRGGYAFATA